jgi:transposase
MTTPRARLRSLGWVVPRQYSTGSKQKLYGISKRGNVYLRRMLIHGARSVLFRVKYDTGGFGQWVQRLAQRAPRNGGAHRTVS